MDITLVQCYWDYLRSYHSSKSRVARGIMPQEVHEMSIELNIQYLGLPETKETLQDEVYLQSIAKELGYNDKTADMRSWRAKEYAKDIGSQYRCLTDIAKHLEPNSSSGYCLQRWFRSNNTLEFLVCWEKGHNKEFDLDTANQYLTEAANIKEWVTRTRAMGIVCRQGRYGGTYAEPIIALDFEMWLSPQYRLSMLEGLYIFYK